MIFPAKAKTRSERRRTKKKYERWSQDPACKYTFKVADFLKFLFDFLDILVYMFLRLNSSYNQCPIHIQLVMHDVLSQELRVYFFYLAFISLFMETTCMSVSFGSRAL